MNAKHIASFVFGAVAGLTAAQYLSMTDEEKEALGNRIKEKANRFKDDTKEYFEDLAVGVADNLKECWINAEESIKDFFGKRTTTNEQTT